MKRKRIKKDERVIGKKKKIGEMRRKLLEEEKNIQNGIRDRGG